MESYNGEIYRAYRDAQEDADFPTGPTHDGGDMASAPYPWPSDLAAEHLSFTKDFGDNSPLNAVHSIVSGRKDCKIFRGKGETVWPPELEAALVEGRPFHDSAYGVVCGTLSSFSFRLVDAWFPYNFTPLIDFIYVL